MKKPAENNVYKSQPANGGYSSYTNRYPYLGETEDYEGIKRSTTINSNSEPLNSVLAEQYTDLIVNQYFKAKYFDEDFGLI